MVDPMQSEIYLRGIRENMPLWLRNFTPGDTVNLADFFKSRVVFYPGSGHDGQPVALFGAAHAAHCFLYVDYGVDQSAIKDDLESRRGAFRGYKTLARIQVHEKDLVPKGWVPHIDIQKYQLSPFERSFSQGFVTPYGFLEILHRFEHLDESHGPQRLAILFLGADGIATYDALFCQGTHPPPFTLVIQEHGFSGSYASFGQEGLLEHVAQSSSSFPEFLLVATNSLQWDNYEEIPNLQPSFGGEYSTERTLFKRKTIP